MYKVKDPEVRSSWIIQCPPMSSVLIRDTQRRDTQTEEEAMGRGKLSPK